MRLPPATGSYNPVTENQRIAQIERADSENHKKRQDVDIGAARLLLTSPNGTRWSLTVDDSGTLSAIAI